MIRPFLYFRMQAKCPKSTKSPRKISLTEAGGQTVRYGQKIDPLISCSQGPEIGKKSGDYGRVVLLLLVGSAQAQKRAPFCPFRICRPLPSSIVKWTRDSSSTTHSTHTHTIFSAITLTAHPQLQLLLTTIKFPLFFAKRKRES